MIELIFTPENELTALKKAFRNRWIQIEERLSEISDLLFELDELTEETSEQEIKKTKVYMLLKQEERMLFQEQTLIEKNGILN